MRAQCYVGKTAEEGRLLTNCGVPDEVFEEARRHFSEKELADLTLHVVAINGWNRLSIAFRNTPGTYQGGAWEKGRAA